MSTYSFPDAMKPEAMMDATAWIREMPAMPVSPLMIHPMAASAAATALGAAAFGQVLGMMMGSMQGAIDASRRIGLPSSDVLFEGASAWWPAVEPASSAKPASHLKAVGTAKPAAPVAEKRPRVVTAPKPAAPIAETKPKAEKPAPAPEAKASETISGLKAAADTAAHAVLETKDAPAAAAKPETRGGLAPEDFKRPPEMAKPETPDDLKQISGIGPKLEQVLNGLGIWKFEQIVAWTSQEVAWLDDYLQFKGRIERDDWQTQAKTLAKAGK